MASNYQHPKSCIICGEPDAHNGPGSHVDYCRKHRHEVEYARKIKGNLGDAIRSQLASVTPDCEPTPTQRAAICYSELSEPCKLYVAYEVGKLLEGVEQKYQEYKMRNPHRHRKHPGMGALSALELFYALVEAGEL